MIEVIMIKVIILTPCSDHRYILDLTFLLFAEGYYNVKRELNERGIPRDPFLYRGGCPRVSVLVDSCLNGIR